MFDPVMGCMLGTHRAGNCNPRECKTCGFYEDEAARRKKLIRNGGLTVDEETGLRRLVLKEEGK